MYGDIDTGFPGWQRDLLIYIIICLKIDLVIPSRSVIDGEYKISGGKDYGAGVHEGSVEPVRVDELYAILRFLQNGFVQGRKFIRRDVNGFKRRCPA